jgi:hypothetical protein
VTRAGERSTHRERVQSALNLHADGMSVRTIADRLSVTPNRAAKLLNEGLRKLPGSEVDDLRAATEVRLDAVAQVYGELLSDPDPRVRAQAANGLLTVERDRSKLLGLWQRPPREDD